MALRIFIGYGFKIYYTLRWVFALTFSGMLMLGLTKQGPINGMPYGVS